MSTTGPYQPQYPVTGTVISVAWAEVLLRAVNYLQGLPLTGDDERPYAVLRQTVAQATTSGASGVVLMDHEDIDTNNGHSTSSNTSRWTCPAGKGGWYHGTYVAGFVSNATNDRAAWMSVSGSGRYGQDISSAAGGRQTYLGGSDRFFLSPGDYVELNVEQFSGSSLNTDVAAGGCRMTIVQERMQ